MNVLHRSATNKAQNPSGLFSAAPIPELRRFQDWFGRRVDEAFRLKAGQMMSEVVLIGPAEAEWLLKKANTGNRPLRSGHAEALAAQMKDGRWRLTAQGLSVSRAGFLNNGQHRLTAIVLSATPVRMYVTFGEDDAAFDVLDVGKIRGGSDVLSILGYTETVTLAATCRLVLGIERNSPMLGSSIANDELDPFIRTHPGIVDAVRDGRKIASKFKGSAAAPSAAAYFIRAHSNQVEDLDTFIDRLVDGVGLPAKNPILTLRDMIQSKSIDEGIRSGLARSVTQTAAIIIAWNLWARHRRATQTSLRWAVGSPFPSVEV